MLKLNDADNLRRNAAGLCLIAGPLVALIGGLVTPWARNDSTAAYLAAMGENPGRAQASAVLLYFGYLLIAAGVFGAMRLLRSRAVVLGHVAGALAIWGWVTLPGLLSVDFYHLSLAAYADRREAVAVMDRADAYAGGVVLGIPVLLGLLGLVLLVVALWRAGFVPVWVPAVLFAGTAVSFVAPVGALSFTTGTAAWLLALGYVGLKILGMSGEEWARGGPVPDLGVEGAKQTTKASVARP